MTDKDLAATAFRLSLRPCKGRARALSPLLPRGLDARTHTFAPTPMHLTPSASPRHQRTYKRSCSCLLALSSPAELLGWCDKVAEHIYDDEFDLEGLSGGLEAAAVAGGLDGLGKRAAGLGARRGGGENDPARAAAVLRLRGKAAAGASGGAAGAGGVGSSALGVKRSVAVG